MSENTWNIREKRGLSLASNADTVDHGTDTRDYGICAARFRGKRKPRQSLYINQTSRPLHDTLPR